MSTAPVASTSTSESSRKLPASITLTPDTLTSFKPAKVFRQHNEPGRPFTSVSYDDRGELLITSSEDETMQLFNCKSGKHQKQLYSKKYGVHLAKFTHKNSTVIHASTKGDDSIRYLSLGDNNYIRYFKGHKKRVVSLEMSPKDDTFLSGATDDTVRLWDLRSANAQGLLNIGGHPTVAFDPTSAVFAVALNLKSTILLYDLRNYDKSPFLNKQLVDPVALSARTPQPMFTSLAFSNDGKYLLAGTSGDVHYVLDAFDGNILARLEAGPGEPMGLERIPEKPYSRPAFEPVAGCSSQEVTWTPDARFVVSGAIDGKVHFWDVAPPPSSSSSSSAPASNSSNNRPPPGPECTLRPFRSVEAHPAGPSRVVKFSPRAAMLATAGNELAFWLPDPEDPAFAGLTPAS